MIFDIGPIDQMTPREMRKYGARFARGHSTSTEGDSWIAVVRFCLIRIWAARA